jgi:hypothetical protein
MHIKQLSPNGYAITDAFDQDTVESIIKQIDTFECHYTRPSGDPLAGHRELLSVLDTFDHTALYKIIQQINANIHINSIELWRDYPGYTNADHRDDPNIENVMIIYFGNGPDDLGTRWYDPNEFAVPYKINTGLILLNSSQILHGLRGEVVGCDYRRALYVNWRNLAKT